MSGFQERETGWEKKLELDENFKFKVMVRRDKALARWAAEKMSMDASEVEDYETSVVRSDLEEAGDDDVVRRVMADFAEKGVPVSEEELRRKLEELGGAAADELHKS